MVFRAKSRLAGSQPKPAKGECFLYIFGGAGYLRRLSFARLALADIACADYRIFFERTFCDDDRRLCDDFSGRQDWRNRAPDVAADAR